MGSLSRIADVVCGYDIIIKDDIQFIQFSDSLSCSVFAVLPYTGKSTEMEKRVFAFGELPALCKLEASICAHSAWRDTGNIPICQVDRD